jgi:hypothetical protein
MPKVTLESVKFAVLDRPLCVWDPNLVDANRRFLRGLDPEFFLHQVMVHAGPAEVDAADASPVMRTRLAHERLARTGALRPSGLEPRLLRGHQPGTFSV